MLVKIDVDLEIVRGRRLQNLNNVIIWTLVLVLVLVLVVVFVVVFVGVGVYVDAAVGIIVVVADEESVGVGVAVAVGVDVAVGVGVAVGVRHGHRHAANWAMFKSSINHGQVAVMMQEVMIVAHGDLDIIVECFVADAAEFGRH